MVTVPENGHYPGLSSNCLPPSPVRSQAAPNPHRESHPVRSTFSWLLCLYLRSGRSLRSKRKWEPYPCGSSSSYQTGQKRKKTTSASEQDGLQRSSPAPEPDADDPADPPAAAGFRGILGGWRVCCTRASFAAARILVNDESSRGDGKKATVSGRGEYLNRATSSAGTVERTSARRESCLERTRLPRAVQPWLARNSKALDPERISHSKSARTSSGICSRKPPHVDSHQSSHDETSHTPESMVSNEETCEADREMDRFLASLAFSRVMEVTPGGTEYGPGKEEEEVR